MQLNVITYLAWIFFVVLAIKNIIFYLYLWQLKEYRWDRFWDYFKTREGMGSFFSKSFLLELTALLIVLIGWFLNFVVPLSLVVLIWLIDLHFFIRSLKRGNFKRPRPTKKALLILLVSLSLAFLAMLLAYFFWTDWLFITALLILIFSADLVSLSVFLVYPISIYFKKKVIAKAKLKISKYPKLKIIGITGSYGKTSVKEFVYEILKDDFRVVKTKENHNSEMGVAQTILDNDFEGREIFVVEMGAYRQGEIRKICKIAPPDLAILTGLDHQHSSLFGGLDKIIKAKSEIIFYSKPKASVVLNYDNPHVREIKIPDNKEKITYGFGGEDWVAEKIKFEDSFLSFEVKGVEFSTQLIGWHNALNILPALVVADKLGLKLNYLISKVKELKPVNEALAASKKGDLILINDSYNASQTGVRAALEALSQFSLPKIVVLDDILELGKMSKEVHQQLAKRLSSMKVEKIILVGKNYSQLIYEQLISLKISKDKLIVLKPEIIKSYLKSLLGQPAVILFEGRQTKKYFEFLNNLDEIN